MKDLLDRKPGAKEGGGSNFCGRPSKLLNLKGENSSVFTGRGRVGIWGPKVLLCFLDAPESRPLA